MPPDSDTVYGIGSITKAFTASAIDILVDQGLLEWITSVLDILPDLNSTSNFVTNELNVVDLLSHKTGLATSNNWWHGAEGTLLLEENQTLPFFNALRPIASFRSRYDYSNWNYALLGEVIEKVSGQSYGSFIKDKILDPLGMNHTSVSHIFDSDDNLALPYAALDEKTSYRVPLPRSQDGTRMAPAQAIQSSVNDLLKYTHALLEAYRHQADREATTTADSILENVVKQLSGYIPRGAPSKYQKEYCLGIHRHHLPNTFEGLGCNSMFFKEMPVLTPGYCEARLVLSHGGSLAGYSTFMSLLPEMDFIVAIFVNSVRLSDPAGWINQFIIETLIDTPKLNDFVQLAREAAMNHALSIAKIAEKFERQRIDIALPKHISKYAGTYRALDRDFLLEIDVKNSAKQQLEVRFQGLDSQRGDLNHYQENTFLLPISFNELSKRAMFTFLNEGLFPFTFEGDSAEKIDKVYWAQDAAVPAEEQFFVRSSGSQQLDDAEICIEHKIRTQSFWLSL